MAELDKDLLAGIDSIYATVLDAGRWPEALERFAGAGGAFGAMLMVSDAHQRELEMNVLSERIGSAEAQAYVKGHLSRDELQWDVALDGVPPCTMLTDEQIWPDRDAYDSMESVRWLRSWNFYHRSAARLCGHQAWRDNVAIIHTLDRPATSPAECERLGLLLPHLARAVEIRRPFTLLKKRYQVILSVLDRLGMGVLLALDDGHILLANAEAERVLDARDGPRRTLDGRFAIPESAGTATQRAALRRALAALRADDEPAGGAFELGRSPDREPYVIELSWVRGDADELGEPIGAALVCLIDPERSDMVSTDALGRVYGLTAAERGVCALITEGHSNAEIAEMRGVSIETVRAQSKAIYRKTRCASRLELVRRALTISPPILGRGDD